MLSILSHQICKSPRGSKFFPFNVDLFSEWDKISLDRITSHEDISTFLNVNHVSVNKHILMIIIRLKAMSQSI